MSHIAHETSTRKHAIDAQPGIIGCSAIDVYQYESGRRAWDATTAIIARQMSVPTSSRIRLDGMRHRPAMVMNDNNWNREDDRSGQRERGRRCKGELRARSEVRKGVGREKCPSQR